MRSRGRGRESTQTISSTWRTAVTAKDLLVDDGSNGQAVEAVCESFPEFNVVTPFTFRGSNEENERKSLVHVVIQSTMLLF